MCYHGSVNRGSPQGRNLNNWWSRRNLCYLLRGTKTGQTEYLQSSLFSVWKSARMPAVYSWEHSFVVFCHGFAEALTRYTCRPGQIFLWMSIHWQMFPGVSINCRCICLVGCLTYSEWFISYRTMYSNKRFAKRILLWRVHCRLEGEAWLRGHVFCALKMSG